MTNIHHTLQEWLSIEHNNISKAKAIITQALILCDNNAENIDQMLLEVYTSNIIMHIELISHLNKSILTLSTKSDNIPKELALSIKKNRDSMNTLIDLYTSLQCIADEKLQELQNKANVTKKILTLL